MNFSSNYKNRGMLLETLINNTINYYKQNKIAFFQKNNLNIKFKKTDNKTENNLIRSYESFIKSKSTVDYCGIYKGRYITFEAKSTEEKNFPFSNIKSHQHEHLKMIHSFGGLAFYIIFFKLYQKVYIINVNDINYENKKSMSFDEVSQNGKEIEIIFPGIIDFLSLINM